jgi:hypothetical protein
MASTVIRFTPRVLIVGLALLCPGAARSSDLGQATRALLDLSPERIAAFNKALQDFAGGWEARGPELYFSARYASAPDGPPSCLVDSPDGIGEVRVPYGRDVAFLEGFFIAGREEDYEHAARRWAGRTIKGSDAARDAADRGGRWQSRFDWNDGPVLGARRGGISGSVGWNSDWKLRFSRPIAGHPGWTWRTWIGERDGETIAGFTVGRSLFSSMSPR